MDAVLLALFSAFLFGAMSVALRLGLRSGVRPESATLLTLLPALGVAALYAGAQGEWAVTDAWPFLLAGLLAPACSQVLFTFAVREAGPSRASVTVGTAPLFAVAIALVFLGEPLVAGLVAGALAIVAGGAVLLGERRRPEHFRVIGIVFALLATLAFATRDSLVRWLGTSATDVEPALGVLATMLSANAAVGVFLLARRRRLDLSALPAFAPAGLCYGISYVSLFEAFYRGPVSVVSPLVATECLWGILLSALVLGRREQVGLRLVLGAALVVLGGVLIGLTR